MSLRVHDDLSLRNSTKTAGTAKDTSIPTEAACGTLDEPHKKKSTRQVPSPDIDETIAPGFPSFLEKSIELVRELEAELDDDNSESSGAC